MKPLLGIGGGLLAVVVIAIGAAWLLPPMLDWSQYRVEIADLASRQLGRDVHINGPPRASPSTRAPTASGSTCECCGCGWRSAR